MMVKRDVKFIQQATVELILKEVNKSKVINRSNIISKASQFLEDTYNYQHKEAMILSTKLYDATAKLGNF